MARPWCFYFVQGEEGESPEEPNVFALPSNGAASLKHFLGAFPLTQQKGGDRVYHARFKVKDDLFGHVWQDVVDPQETLPVYQGAVHVKVLRLDKPPRPTTRLRRKPLGTLGGARPAASMRQDLGRGTAATAQSTTSSSHVATPPRRPDVSTASSGVAATAVPSAARPPTSSSSGRSTQTVEQGGSVKAPGERPSESQGRRQAGGKVGAPPGSTAASGDDLDRFLYGSTGSDTPASPSSSQSSRPQPRSTPHAVQGGLPRVHSSPPPVGTAASPPPPRAHSASPGPRPGPPLFAGMAGLDIDEDDSPPPPPSFPPSGSGRGGPTPPPKGPSPPPATPEELFFMQPTTTKQAEAAKEEQEADALRQRVGPRLEQWARDPPAAGGKLRNIRSLLSTMHTVLWADSAWKPVFLGDLMAPERVKFYYRKAMLVVHPDKNVTGSAEQRFVAEKVFTSVNEAYTVFAAKELK
ncbi:hypothetical protein NSK_003654 [Nannochloropsis salina CCMP1776]|uniref:J domain-containing protein n=1 Tax=Nannochloropsis salina CCMP1776 TaxID=1027361 RepID=A0A4D9D0N6_9STRA|nr:hypothetical protein NSK_003654 [Nannochloropsis salina CCMP1776]|eukprot:TFJ85231.1 hypothetical protein NSK_003654 [Nannochloropsis salina CCMP1776]